MRGNELESVNNMVHCVASESCKSNSKNNSQNPNERIHFFSVPKDDELRLKWQEAINRPNFVLKPGQRVCQKHFRPEEILKVKVIKDYKGNVIQTVSLIFIWNLDNKYHKFHMRHEWLQKYITY